MKPSLIEMSNDITKTDVINKTVYYVHYNTDVVLKGLLLCGGCMVIYRGHTVCVYVSRYAHMS